MDMALRGAIGCMQWHFSTDGRQPTSGSLLCHPTARLALQCSVQRASVTRESDRSAVASFDDSVTRESDHAAFVAALLLTYIITQ